MKLTILRAAIQTLKSNLVSKYKDLSSFDIAELNDIDEKDEITDVDFGKCIYYLATALEDASSEERLKHGSLDKYYLLQIKDNLAKRPELKKIVAIIQTIVETDASYSIASFKENLEYTSELLLKLKASLETSLEKTALGKTPFSHLLKTIQTKLAAESKKNKLTDFDQESDRTDGTDTMSDDGSAIAYLKEMEALQALNQAIAEISITEISTYETFYNEASVSDRNTIDSTLVDAPANRGGIDTTRKTGVYQVLLNPKITAVQIDAIRQEEQAKANIHVQTENAKL